MADSQKFARIEKPTSLGTACWTCSSGSHPENFVKFNHMNIMDGGFGNVALCVGCVHELGRVVGMLDPEQTSKLHGIVDELTEATEKLREELAREKLDKVVPLAEIVDFFEERAKRRPEEPEPATKPVGKTTTKPKATA